MNPYQQWLGLYNFSGMKPNYYELLGLQFGESNPYVIEQAANEMATRLNSVNPGPDVALWNSIMTEIQNAQMCLCNPASKMDYDNSLRGGMGGFGGGYSAGSAFGGGNMGYAQPTMAQPPMSPVSGGFGGGYSAGSAFGGAPSPQIATPPIPSAPPVPSAPGAASPSSVRPAATPVAAPVATAAVAATAVTATAVASTAKAAAPTPPPSPTGGANLNLGNSKKKKVHKKGAAAGAGALYGVYTALGIGGLILLIWLISSLANQSTEDSKDNHPTKIIVVDNSPVKGKDLPRAIEKKVDETEKVKPVAAPKRKVISRRNKEGIPIREVVDADNAAGDDVVIGDGRIIDGEVTDDAPDIRELGVSDDKGGVIDERADDFRIGTNRVVVDDNDNVDSVEEAIEHATGIDIAPNEDGETAPNFSARRDEGGNVEVIDDPRLGTGYEGAVQVTRRPRASIFDADKPAAVENVQPAVENNVQPAVENNVQPAIQPASGPTPEDVSYDNIAEDLVIEKSAPDVETPAVEEQPAPAVEQSQPAAEQPKAEEPKPAPEQPKAEEPKPAEEQPKTEEPKPAPEQPKAEEPKPAAEQPKAEPAKPAEAEQPKTEPQKPAKPAKLEIPRESELMAAESRIDADNADALKSGDSSSKVALAQKLMDNSASQSPADQYAALTKARNLATDAKNVDVALKAIELKAKAFNNVDSYNEGVDVLLSCKPNAWPESQKKAVAAAAEKWLGVAKKKNESRTAKKLQEIIDANK